MQTKTFKLGTVLSVTTGRLLTERKSPNDNGIGDMYEILSWITGWEAWTHSLGRSAEEAKPWLLKCFPELRLAEAGLQSLQQWIDNAPTCPDEGIKMWLAELLMMHPEIQTSYEVEPMPNQRTEHPNPLVELQQMAPNVKTIAVQL